MTRITELAPLLKQLRLVQMAATLPERIALARREQLDYASFLEIIFSDEVNRRARRRIELRLNGAGFEETCRLGGVVKRVCSRSSLPGVGKWPGMTPLSWHNGSPLRATA